MVLRAKIGRYPRDAPVLLHLVQLGIEFRDVNSSGSLQPVNHSHSLAALRAGVDFSGGASCGLSLFSLSLSAALCASRDPLPNLGT